MSNETENEQTPDTCSHQCSSCSSNCSERTEPVKTQMNAASSVKHVIGVVSGKGGVGKTLVTCLLAAELTKKGYKVGILDADATGPSIPRAFGVTGPLYAKDDGLEPAVSELGTKIMSTNLLLPKEDMPIAWRGPLITGMIDQFFSEVNWGDLDYMLIDMPPGTSDVLLTVLQKLPVESIVTVSAPQELVGMIVGKAVNLAQSMNVEVKGIVENMAYFVCPDCEKKHYIFGEPQGAEIAQKYNIPSHATLPLDPEFARKVDAGQVEQYELHGELEPIIEALNN